MLLLLLLLLLPSGGLGSSRRGREWGRRFPERPLGGAVGPAAAPGAPRRDPRLGGLRGLRAPRALLAAERAGGGLSVIIPGCPAGCSRLGGDGEHRVPRRGAAELPPA